MHPPSTRLLRGALLANALFSAGFGVAGVLAAPVVAATLGAAPPALVRLLGGGLVVFALFVARVAWRPTRPLALGIVVADWAWVGGSLLLAATGGASGLSSAGVALVLALAAPVAFLAGLQGVGLARARPHPAPAASVALRVEAPAADAWRVIGTRWGDVHRIVPSIARSRIVAGVEPGPRCERLCELARPVAGLRKVRERVVAWDPPVGFTYEMVDLPFPFAQLQNSWRIEDHGPHSVLHLTPVIELRGGAATRWLRGLVLRALMRGLDEDVAQMGALVAAEARAPQAKARE